MAENRESDLFGAPREEETTEVSQRRTTRLRSTERTTRVAVKKPSFDAPTEQPSASPNRLEEQLLELEAIVEKLESGEVGLEESISLYEKGTALGKACTERLSSLEQRILLIRKGASGELEQTPYGDDES
ncbi:MAG: exodeoxyribonuclease VII small subunit [Candidatus Sumerlaeia bacterium]|nr:exodeoxyribonuclease VII small subunit [Candidatus Sumerlaeia bacterium]